MAIEKLSALQVEKQKRPGLYGDGGGLWLQVTDSKSGKPTKAWVFRYMLQGRARKMGLGAVHTVPLKLARERAADLRLKVHDGIDPLAEREALAAAGLARAAKPTKTFQWCAEQYIAGQEAEWKNSKHRQQWRNTLTTYVYPVLGALPVSSIDTELVLQVIEPIWAEKRDTAGRIRGRIETVLNWARARGYRDGDNPARFDGHLKETLPKRSKTRGRKHHAALPYDEVPAFMAELRTSDFISAKALELTILTALRTSEVTCARPEEIDFTKKTWAVPAERMKAGKEHVVPLSDRAIEILQSLDRSGSFLFPGQRTSNKDKPLSNMAMLTYCQSLRPGITVHGFRSSFRDWAGDRTSYPHDLIETALAHAIKDKTEAAYRRSAALEKRARLMADWSSFCATPMAKGQNVVTIGASR